MVDINSTQCCGLKEIDGLSGTTPTDALREVCREFFEEDHDAAFFFFTGVSREKYGQRFKALLKKENLGPVIETKATRNPNSGNLIKTWIWTIDRARFKAYARKHSINTSRSLSD